MELLFLQKVTQRCHLLVAAERGLRPSSEFLSLSP